MQTTFSACSRLACLRIPGSLRELEVNHRVWLPIHPEVNLGCVHQPFIFVAAVAHHGIDEAGHLQALGLGAGWMMFDDLRGSGCCIRTAPETVVLRSFPVKVRRSISHAKTQHFVHPLSFNNAFRTRLPSKMQVADV